jgi:hypothetical protein
MFVFNPNLKCLLFFHQNERNEIESKRKEKMSKNSSTDKTNKMA